MSKGCFCVIGCSGPSSDRLSVFNTTDKEYIPVRTIESVTQTYAPLGQFVVNKTSWLFITKVYGDFCKCKMKTYSETKWENCPNKCYCACKLSKPVYIISTKDNSCYLVHPDEDQHMQRYLAGTDDPLYDLVHELRFNPAFKCDPDLQEAKNKHK